MAAAASPQRIVLIGAPARLQGLVRLSNPGVDKLKIKSAPLRLKGGAAEGVQLSLGARLAAGATAHTQATLQLDPRTPPGELHGQVMVGDEAREVLIKVLEHREVALTPDRFTLHGAPGARITMPLIVTNLGNVPFQVPRVALVALGQAQAFEQLFHVAMATAGAAGHQAALDAFARLLHGSEVAAPKVRFGAGAGRSLAPGEALETEIAFELPDTLARHRVYLGSFAVGRAQCTVEIEVDTPVNDDEPDKPAPRARRKT